MNDNRSEIRLEGVPSKTKNELKNIAKNLGVTLNGFLKPKLKEIADSYPEELKSDPKIN